MLLDFIYCKGGIALRKLFRKLHKDNKGATLIMAIVAVGFVGVLAGVILSAAGTTYRLKIMDENSKKSFYSAESVVEEVYAGTGRTCFQTLSDAYTKTASAIYMHDPSTGKTNKVRNEVLNETMKGYYMADIKSKILGDTGIQKENAIAYITSNILNTTNARVANIANIVESAESITLDDVLIEYKSSGTNQYYSTVQVDINVGYPDIFIDFVEFNEDWEEYFKYSLIAMEDITSNNSMGISISGGAFAGEDVNLLGNSNITLENDVIAGKIPTRLVCGGMVDLQSNTSLVVKGADIWCDNLNIGFGTDKADITYYATDSHTYVADDLSLNGNKSKVILKGNYVGFGGSNDVVSASSAIIVNGMNCSLDMTGVNSLTLAGKGYLNLLNEDDPTPEVYETGDSLALKGNQEIYLVPAGYVGLKAGTTGGSASNPTATPDKVTINLNNFFAYRLGLLDTANPYVARKVHNKTYYYLNFVSSKAQNDYVRAVITDGYLNALFVSKGVSGPTSADHVDRNSLRSHVEQGLMRFFSDGNEILLNDAASVYTSGSLVEVIKGSSSVPVISVIGSEPVDDLTAIAGSSSNKYRVIKSFLTLGNDDNVFSAFPIDFKIDESEFNITEEDLITPYERTVKLDKLQTLENSVINIDTATGTIGAVVTYKDLGGAYDIPMTCNGGVVLAYGVDVNVYANFEGLIITDKSINIKYSMALTPGTSERAKKTIEYYKTDADETNDIHIYFQEAESSSETPGIGEIDVKEMIQFSDWRKNESA